MITLITSWWLFFWTALGLCLGSFLNVVIYRIPRNLSLSQPVWSACPHCQNRISWYDNLPVLSYIMLRGRCRHCHEAISARYPIIELLTALVVMVVFDAFFIARTRLGLVIEADINWAIADDWPIYLAHVVLFTCLLPMAAIDLKEYWLDIRFTAVATWFGFALNMIWTPRYRSDWPRPADGTAMAALGAMIGLAALWLWLRRRPPDYLTQPEDTLELGPLHPAGMPTDEWRSVWQPIAQDDSSELAGAAVPDASSRMQRRLGLIAAVLIGGVLALALVSMLMASADLPPLIAMPWRSIVPLLLIVGLVLSEAVVCRESDHEIIEAIEAERYGARRMALGELGLLIPAIILGFVGIWLMWPGGEYSAQLTSVLHWQARPGWQPVYGLATAASGYVIGGAIGWVVRIGGTLLFGKEAFGLGDIHIMAAAGSVAGWPVVLLGFFVTIFVTLAALVLMLPFKRARGIPLVPWLTIGYLIVVIHYEFILHLPWVQNNLEVFHLLVNRTSQALSAGVGP